MEPFVQNLTSLLGQKFPGAKVELEEASGTRFGGFLIWDGFEGKEQIDRQTQVWDILRHELAREEQRRISALFTITPDEAAAMQED